jgi:tripartite-type tricarboxylate transporter receptor subunit TctC
VRAGTPPAIVDRLHRDLVNAARLPEVVSHLAADGSRPMTQSPAEFGAFIRNEIAKWNKVAAAAGLIVN